MSTAPHQRIEKKLVDTLRFRTEPDSGIEIVGTGLNGDADCVLKCGSRTARNQEGQGERRKAKGESEKARDVRLDAAPSLIRRLGPLASSYQANPLSPSIPSLAAVCSCRRIRPCLRQPDGEPRWRQAHYRHASARSHWPESRSQWPPWLLWEYPTPPRSGP